MPVFVEEELKTVEPIALGRVDLAMAEIQQAPLEKLRDARWLEHHLLPRLGFNAEQMSEFPEELYPWCGHGVRSWQYPSQFSKYLVHLSGKQVRSYLEIGCRHGGTFIITVEYLKRFQNVQVACAMDIAASPIMQEYKRLAPATVYALMSSVASEGRRLIRHMQWDLTLIDGDHSYEACRTDYETVRDHARLIALHDITSSVCPGVERVWREISGVAPVLRRAEFVDQYESVVKRTGQQFLGIGLVDFG